MMLSRPQKWVGGGHWATVQRLTYPTLLAWKRQVHTLHMLEQNLLASSSGYFVLDRAVVALINTQLGR